MNPTHTIIPAEPGWRFVYADDEDGSLSVDDAVVAWCITLTPDDNGEAEWPHVNCRGIGPTGMMRAAHGYMAPSGAVDTFDCGRFESLAEADTESRRQFANVKAMQERERASSATVPMTR